MGIMTLGKRASSGETFANGRSPAGPLAARPPPGGWPRLAESGRLGIRDGDAQATLPVLLVEVPMEWGIVPRQAVPSGELLEPGEIAFRQLGCRVIARVAEIDAATQGASLACRAAPEQVLPRAGRAVIQGALRRRSLAQEELDLGLRDEQGVTVLAKPTAAAAELTDRREPGDLGIELGVEGAQLGVQAGFGVRAAGNQRWVCNHHLGTIAREDWISASE